ncbi:MAG: hypothetical protein ACXABY_09255, partial [Candidatus Thorarchaeota archaeon]
MTIGGMGITPDGELFLIGIQQVTALDGNGLKLTDDAGNLGIFVEDGGRVGIGHASPEVKFHVEESTNDNVFALIEATSSTKEAGLWLKTALANDWWSISTEASANRMRIWNQAFNSGIMYMLSSGQVLINDTANA